MDGWLHCISEVIINRTKCVNLESSFIRYFGSLAWLYIFFAKGNLFSTFFFQYSYIPNHQKNGKLLVQGPGGFMSPPRGGKRHSVFWRVIGCPDYSWMPPFISGELFGLRVERKNEYISKLPKNWEISKWWIIHFFICLWGQWIQWASYFCHQR